MSDLADNPPVLRGRGGWRPNSGRPRGVASKMNEQLRTLRNEALSMRQRFAKMPLDHMLEILNDESQPLAMRNEMAWRAAPYLHTKLASIELIKTDGDQKQQQTIDCTRLSESELADLERLLLKGQPATVTTLQPTEWHPVDDAVSREAD